MDFIAAQVDANGIFYLRDDKTGELLALKFGKIHDPVPPLTSVSDAPASTRSSSGIARARASCARTVDAEASDTTVLPPRCSP